MNNKKFKDGLRKHKGSIVPIKNNPNKAFIAKLKKQILSDYSSSNTENVDSNNFDKLFADLDDYD